MNNMNTKMNRDMLLDLLIYGMVCIILIILALFIK